MVRCESSPRNSSKIHCKMAAPPTPPLYCSPRKTSELKTRPSKLLSALFLFFPPPQCLIYSGSDLGPSELAERAMTVFGIKLSKPVRVVRLKKTDLVLPERYPRFTLAGQAFGSIVLGIEALRR